MLRVRSTATDSAQGASLDTFLDKLPQKIITQLPNGPLEST